MNTLTISTMTLTDVVSMQWVAPIVGRRKRRFRNSLRIHDRKFEREWWATVRSQQFRLDRAPFKRQRQIRLSLARRHNCVQQ